MKVFNLPVGGERANHVNFMKHMLVSHSSCYFNPLEGNNTEVSKYLLPETSLAGFHAILTCGPV